MSTLEEIILIQKAIKDTLEPIYKIQEQYASMMDPIVQTQEIINNFRASYINQLQSMSRDVIQAANSIVKINQSFSDDYSRLIKNLINDLDVMSGIYDSYDFSSIAKASAIAINTLAEAPSEQEENDYVTFDESHIKEWDISETVAIPIGNSRIRMKTSDFITLLAAISTILLTLLGLCSDKLDSESSNQSIQQLIEIEQRRNSIEDHNNKVLNEWIESIDTSNASNSDAIEHLILSIEDLTECLQVLESTRQESDSAPASAGSVPDSIPEKTDNSFE